MRLVSYLESYITEQPAEQVLHRRSLIGHSELAISTALAAVLLFTHHEMASLVIMVPGMVGGILASISDNIVRQWKAGGPEFVTPLKNKIPTLLFGREKKLNDLEWPDGTKHGDDGRMTDCDIRLD